MKNWIRKVWDWFVGCICEVPMDKWLHFIAGLIIAACCNICFDVLVCIGPVIVAGLLKEVFDKYTTGKVDFYDVLATVFGGAVIQLFALL